MIYFEFYVEKSDQTICFFCSEINVNGGTLEIKNSSGRPVYLLAGTLKNVY